MSRVKRKSTFFTEAKVQAARTNVNRYEWAAAMKHQAVALADRLVERGLDYVWELAPSQALPRSYQTNQILGNLSPLSSEAPGDNPLNKISNYPWKADPLHAPWKLTDPTTGMQFPANDFGAYYRSGLNEQGEFEPLLADRSLLVNTLYPERGADWGVDDGFGWLDPETGRLYTFIAYYTHWFLWFGAEGLILRSLDALRDAYLYTGEGSYARAGLVLLDRIADLYPKMDVSLLDPKLYYNSHGGGGQGKTVGCIWETSTAKTLVGCYDAFFPAIGDPELVRYLSARAERHRLSDKSSSDAIAQHIENGILREVFEGFKTAKIRGNNGFHQSALALAAVVLDSEPETSQWLDYVFQAGRYIPEEQRITGGNVRNMLLNEVDRDGHGNEAAPGYNRLWLNTLRQVADVLDGYEGYAGADLYLHPKFRKLFQGVYPLTMIERYTVQIGDTGKTGNPGTLLSMDECVLAFRKYGDPIFAQLAYWLNGNRADGVHADIFTDEPERIAGDIKRVIEEHGTYRQDSVHLSGYGFAALRTGVSEAGAPPEKQGDVWLYYGFNGGHGHRDTLNIGLHAYGLDLMPDLGYPEQANHLDRHRAEWCNNTISHNTVVVDREKQQLQWVGRPKHFDGGSGRFVQLIDVEAPDVYPQLEQYRRTTALIRVDGGVGDDGVGGREGGGGQGGEAGFYAVDFFRVQGGTEHHFSFHAAEGEAEVDGLRLTPQQSGTYAGEDVQFGERPEEDSVTGSAYSGGGFHWLKRVERAVQPAPGFSIDWSIKDTWNVLGGGIGAETGIHLRLTMLTSMDEVVLADGVPPRNKGGNPATLRYMVGRRTAADAAAAAGQLDSLFTSVVEPYKAERLIASIDKVGVMLDGAVVGETEAQAIKVTFADGRRTDWIIWAGEGGGRGEEAVGYLVDGCIEFSGFFGVYSRWSDGRSYRYVMDGPRIGPIGLSSFSEGEGTGRFTGEIVDFTRNLSGSNYIDISFHTGGNVELESLQGATLYVEAAASRNAVFTIMGGTCLASGVYRLDIGDVTLIRSNREEELSEESFDYEISVGSTFYIPLRYEAFQA